MNGSPSSSRLHNATAPTAGAQTLLCPRELSRTIITSHPTGVFSVLHSLTTGHLPQLHNPHRSVGLFRRNPAHFLFNTQVELECQILTSKQPCKSHEKNPQQTCLFLLLDINSHTYRIKKAVGANGDMVNDLIAKSREKIVFWSCWVREGQNQMSIQRSIEVFKWTTT